jgi:uncharacterized membrane protein
MMPYHFPLSVFFLQIFNQLFSEFFFVFEELLMAQKAGVFALGISSVASIFKALQQNLECLSLTPKQDIFK